MCSSSIPIILVALCSSVLATGHLRLEFTSSNDCDFRLTTDFSTEIIRLRIGETRTSSFHPRSGEKTVQISFSIDESPAKNKTFPFEVSTKPRRDVFIFSELAVLIQSIFECDTGYHGPQCMVKMVSTSPTSSTSTTTTTVTSSAETVRTNTTQLPMETNNLIPSEKISSLANLVIGVLIFVAVTLLILIIVVCCLLFSHEHHVYIEPTIDFETKKKSPNSSCSSSCSSPDTARYTAAPHTWLNISIS